MRKAGILLPIFALPSPYGIGTMGHAAYEFINFMVQAGQTCWQLLPVGPTSFGDSPYQSFSSFAGNPYFVDLDLLCEQGLLQPQEYQTLAWCSAETDIDYARLYRLRYSVLRIAVKRLWAQQGDAVETFCHRETDWLADYALFMALKDHFGGAPWMQWPEPLRLREASAVAHFRAEHADAIAFWQGVQYLFFNQWDLLKAYANRCGIEIIGDLPIYTAYDSADVWAQPHQFQLDAQLRPTEVAGCPPDGYSAKGQLWGNPLFDWDAMAKDGYRWWIHRVEAQFRFFDVLRIDHFRGFDGYYAIPAGAADACIGRWRKGPGIAFFRALEAQLGKREIIAEDLGFLTPSVLELVAQTGFPGMKVLEFAFDSRDCTDSTYLPHKYPRNCIAYVGTHDNDTALGWLQTARPDDAAMAREYLTLSAEEGEHWGMMRGIWSSVADIAVVQMQDLLGLDGSARMNVPSTVGGNWRWRMPNGSLTTELAEKLHRKMKLYGRLSSQEKTTGV